MKHIFLILFIAFSIKVSAQVQYNPFVKYSNVSPSPLYNVADSGVGSVSFTVGNSGNNPLTVTAIYHMGMILTFSRGIPNNVSFNPTDTNPVNIDTAISGSYKQYFSWVYYPIWNTLFATQILDIPPFDSGIVKIEYKVVSNSTTSSLENGFNLNVQPPPYANGDNNQADDNVSGYTWTISRFTFDLNPDINVTNKNVLVTGDLRTNDTVTSSTYGTPVAVGVNPSTDLPTINANGTYTFTPSAVGVYTFNVPVCPSGQTTNCPINLLTITVLDPNTTNNPPVANTDIATTVRSTPITINTLSNDKSGNAGVSLNPASVTITDQPSNGTVSVNSTTGAITYTPNNFFVGIDTLTYNVCDSSSPTPFCATALQIITVLPLGNPNSTSATDDYVKTKENVSISGNALTNDRDPENNTLKVTAQNITTSAGSFTIDTNGNYTFIPGTGFTGPTSFSYQVCDNGIPVACTKATIYILVNSDIGTLPIKFNNINVTLNDCKVTLDWMMNGYENTDLLEIKRANSIDRQFETIFSSVISSLISKNQQYSFVDNNLIENGEYVYQLTITEANGSISNSELKIAKFDCKNTSIFVYPNPTSDFFTINFNEKEANSYSIVLTDVSGRIVKILNTDTQIGNNELKIDINELASGNYFLKVMNSKSKESKTIKIRID